MRPGQVVDGLKIAKARGNLKLTQAAFAERVGIHWVTMNRIENGKARVSLELLEAIAAETGETREHFLVAANGSAGDDEEEPSLDVALRMMAAALRRELGVPAR